MTLHVSSILERAAAQCPERVALKALDASGDTTVEWTYAQWLHGARGWSAWLHGCDVGHGERVGLLAGNGLGFAAQWFGVLGVGAAVVPIPVTSSAQEVAARLEHAQCRVLICDEARLDLARAAIANVARRPILVLDADVSIAPTSAVLRAVNAGPGDDATAMILYTSGTTGDAKGACISHHALLKHTEILSEHVLQLDGHDRVLGVLPLTHSYGCRMLLLAAAYAQATTVLMSRFDAAISLRVIDAERITWVPAVPTMFAAWSDAVEQTPKLRPRGGSLKWAMSAGAPIAEALVTRAEAALGVKIRQAYGMTEATLSTVNGPADARVIGSVGRAVPGVSLRVVDSNGSDVATGERGEVWVRGHNTMNGYLDDPNATASAFHQGWLKSGDVGCVDAEGNLWIVDRIKDLIIRGGFNVVPAEVEAVIAEHPAVAQVAVVGRPDDYYGEEVVAFVVRKHGALLDAAALLSWCQSRMSKVKRPREVVFCDSFPLGPSGKVLKRALRQQAIELEGSGSGTT